VRSPVAAALLTAQQLRRSSPEGPVTAAADRFLRALRRVEEVLDSLLDLTQARIGAGISVKLATVDFGALCAQVAEELRVARPGAEIRLEGRARGRADPARVAQAVQALVDNALRYGRPGAPVRIRVREAGEEVVVEVENEGEPIPPAIAGRLFDPFVRGGREGDTVRQSGGLGLYRVAAIARAHRGSVSLERNDGAIVVALRLPRGAAQPEPVDRAQLS
jgi:signal transduction histidine kinase